MKSIGIWYKAEGQKLPKLEFHINLWNLKNKGRSIPPFIDFGVGILEFRNIQSLEILLPFNVDENEIIDLYEHVKDSNIAKLIFNDIECEISSKYRYSVIESPNFVNSKLLINIKNSNRLETFVKYDCSGDGTKLIVNLEELKEDDKFYEYQNLYFRFRMIGKNIGESLFCPVKRKNWFLESGFVETQIIDIKINQERNLPDMTCEECRKNKYKFAMFSKIHLLIMCNSGDELEAFGTGIDECRKLEEHGWDKYLENRCDTSSVLAYHWKEKCEDKKEISSFSKLIRVTTPSTNAKVIFTYIMVVIFLGACGSAVFDFIKMLLEA